MYHTATHPVLLSCVTNGMHSGTDVTILCGKTTHTPIQCPQCTIQPHTLSYCPVWQTECIVVLTWQYCVVKQNHNNTVSTMHHTATHPVLLSYVTNGMDSGTDVTILCGKTTHTTIQCPQCTIQPHTLSYCPVWQTECIVVLTWQYCVVKQNHNNTVSTMHHTATHPVLLSYVTNGMNSGTDVTILCGKTTHTTIQCPQCTIQPHTLSYCPVWQTECIVVLTWQYCVVKQHTHQYSVHNVPYSHTPCLTVLCDKRNA